MQNIKFFQGKVSVLLVWVYGDIFKIYVIYKYGWMVIVNSVYLEFLKIERYFEVR